MFTMHLERMQVVPDGVVPSPPCSPPPRQSSPASSLAVDLTPSRGSVSHASASGTALCCPPEPALSVHVLNRSSSESQLQCRPLDLSLSPCARSPRRSQESWQPPCVDTSLTDNALDLSVLGNHGSLRQCAVTCHNCGRLLLPSGECARCCQSCRQTTDITRRQRQLEEWAPPQRQASSLTLGVDEAVYCSPLADMSSEGDGAITTGDHAGSVRRPSVPHSRVIETGGCNDSDERSCRSQYRGAMMDDRWHCGWRDPTTDSSVTGRDVEEMTGQTSCRLLADCSPVTIGCCSCREPLTSSDAGVFHVRTRPTSHCDARDSRGHSTPYFPHLAVWRSRGRARLVSQCSVAVCVFCYHALHRQWRQRQSSGSPADTRYNTRYFTCCVCAVVTYRRRVSLLSVKEFPFLTRSHQLPAGGMLVCNGTRAVVCRDCYHTLRSQFDDYERLGLPVALREYNWVQRLPPPESPPRATSPPTVLSRGRASGGSVHTDCQQCVEIVTCSVSTSPPSRAQCLRDPPLWWRHLFVILFRVSSFSHYRHLWRMFRSATTTLALLVSCLYNHAPVSVCVFC